MKSDQPATRPTRKRWTVKWTHPVTLLLLTTLISTTGWAISHFIIERDNSDLRFEVQSLSQEIALITPQQPRLNGAPVFCDTARLTLLIAHSNEGANPVRIDHIAFNVDPISHTDATNNVDCTTDMLASKPFGVNQKRTYNLEFSDTSRTGRYFKSGRLGDTIAVNPNDILESLESGNDITLNAKDPPIGYDISVQCKNAGFYRVWFVATYDAGGPKTLSTAPFIMSRQSD